MSTGTGYTRGGVQMSYYRAPAYVQPVAPQPRPGPTVTDDYERWYTEATSNNRMLLALRCGIHQEIGWALDRLCRLCNNEQFMLRVIPGLTDALFEWPEWYVKENEGDGVLDASLFSFSPDQERKRRHALESLFILRNAALNEPNAQELAAHPRTRNLILRALHGLTPDSDANTEFLLHSIELLQAVASAYTLPSPSSPAHTNPILPIQHLSNHSVNRSMIIACLTALTLFLSNPFNVAHLSSTSPALAASIRYLPLFHDKPLVDACLNYLYTHLSHPPMAKAFLLHTDMPSTLKLLVSLLISEQVEEEVILDISPPVYTAPPLKVKTVNYEITGEELEALVSKPEPERCYEWMRKMFVPKTESELTQVDFWNLYKDIFSPYQERHQLLVASDVIKNVNVVFQSAQAMVLPGPPQKFVVRGVDRRQTDVLPERFKCQWDRSSCNAAAFQAPEELYAHIQTHLESLEGPYYWCMWSTCEHSAPSLLMLLPHVLTHLSPKTEYAKDFAQPDRITLSSEGYPHPIAKPTERPPPPPPRATVAFPVPAVDPPSSSLTALLAIRTLFRAAFASADAAPRADADHFGFPGAVDEQDGEDGEERGASASASAGLADSEREGERRGRRAFTSVRRLMEGVRIRDPALMAWITEMIDAGITGTH